MGDPPTGLALRPYAREAAARNGIDGSLLEKQIQAESGFNPDAHNASSGADGIAQIVVRFHPTMAGKTRDPIASIDYMAGLMRNHLAVWNGDWAKSLSAYNAGPAATAQGLAGTLDGWPYAETVRYVATILGISRAEAATRLTTGAAPMAVRFDATFPATIQDDDWSCAPSSLDWALRSLGRAPGHSYIENLLIADGIVSKSQGLLVATGAPLAAWIGKKTPPEVYYGADGFYGNSEPSITFDGAALEGDHAYPILIGGRNWGGPGKGHWAGVRGYDAARDVLLLANPAGAGGVFGGQEMTRAQFNARGPFSMVRVLHPDIDGSTATPTPPIPPIPPTDTRLARAAVVARELLAILEGAP